MLSVVIITFNEEKNIARCIDSVKEIADEIIVVDSFSTDKTCEIATNKGAKVVQHPFEGHIQQKNYAQSLASHRLILSLDADEALSDILRNSIIAIKENPAHQGYSMNRLTFYCGKPIKHCGWYPDKKLRIWQKNTGEWGGLNPHDEFSLFNKKEKVQHLKGDILHYSYYSIAEHYAQAEKFSTISAKAMHERGKKANIIRPYLSASIRFLKDYFYELGFLDGHYGFTICKINALTTFWKYQKLRAL